MLEVIVWRNMAKYYMNCNDNRAKRSVNMFLTTYQTTGKTIMIRSDAAFSPDFYHLGIKQKELVLLPDESFHQKLVSNLGYDASGVYLYDKNGRKNPDAENCVKEELYYGR